MNLHTARMAVHLLRLGGLHPVLHGAVIGQDGFAVRIASECSVVFMALLLVSFILSFPARWPQRMPGLLIGLPVLHVLNIVRIALVFAVGVRFPRLFEAAHVYLSQVAMVLVLFGSCLLWLKSLKGDSDRRHLPASPLLRAALISAVAFLLWLPVNDEYVRATDALVLGLFELAGYRFGFDYAHQIYFQTFNLVLFAALLLALPAGGAGNRRRLFFVGGLLIVCFHLLIRTCNVLYLAFGLPSAEDISILLTTCGQYLLPALIYFGIRGQECGPKATELAAPEPQPRPTGRPMKRSSGSRKSRSSSRMAVALSLALALLAPPDDARAAAPAVVPGEYLVVFRDEGGRPARLEEWPGHYRAVKRRLEADFRREGIATRRDFSHLPMALVDIADPKALERVRRHPRIEAVMPNHRIFPLLAESLPLARQTLPAMAGYTGAGTTIAIVDTGADYTRSAFGSCSAPGVPGSCRVVAAVDIAGEDGSPDDHGHGTHVAAIAAAFAEEAGIAAIDVFNADGTSTDALVIGGINWAIANQAAYHIAAINLSLGDGSRYTSPCGNKIFNPYLTPIANALDAGILTVAATGNQGYSDAISRPACTPDAISVGAVYDAAVGGLSYGVCSDSQTTANQVACFSNSASFQTLLAPGALITAAGSTLAGTSQAAPHVAAAVAVLRSAYPAESPAETRSRLTQSTTLITDSRNGLSFPALDLEEAGGVSAQTASVPALSPWGALAALALLALVGRRRSARFSGRERS